MEINFDKIFNILKQIQRHIESKKLSEDEELLLIQIILFYLQFRKSKTKMQEPGGYVNYA